MGLVEIFIIALGLSVDSFAVSVCAGLANKRPEMSKSLRLAVVFGLFQGLAPVAGALLGISLRSLIENVDHWIALILLVLVGLRMILEGLGKGSLMLKGSLTTWRRLFVLGMATSIDALVVGISMGLVGVSLWKTGFIVGLVTAVVSFIGISIGSRFKKFSKMKLEIVAGIFLIAIGLKIFIEHLLNLS